MKWRTIDTKTKRTAFHSSISWTIILINISNSIRSFALVTAFLMFSCGPANSAEKVRFYPFGEADNGAVVGEIALETEDIWEPPTEDADGNPVFDAIGDFVPLTAFDNDSAPIYVAGRENGLAVDFDGVDDLLQSEAFDPRNFNTFSALSQGWVLADEAGSGTEQGIWSLGSDNGGLGITAGGFWNLRAVNGAPERASNVAVAFGEWTHLAVFRGGNSARLYVNGELAVSPVLTCR